MMLIDNMVVTVAEITMNVVILTAETGDTIEIPRHVLPDVAKGMELYLALDDKLLVNASQHAKDVLNEVIKKT